MRTIAISLQKGGVGKTSISVSIAAALVPIAGRVLLIDADPQGNTSAWIGAETISAELADVLTEKTALKEAITKTACPGLDLLPSAGLGGDLKTYAESGAKDDPLCLRRLVKSVAAMGYHYTIIDLSPAWGAIERAAALAADEIITPVLGDSFAVDGLQIFTENLTTLKKRFDTDRPEYRRIIVNATDGRIKQHGETLSAIRGIAGGALTVYSIPVDPAFRMAQRKHLFPQDLTITKQETRQSISAIAHDIHGGNYGN
jgi:chromosome partitioning protein